MIRRTTIQNELVLDAVKQLQNHPTADEVYELVQATHPNISKGTVYRNLNRLAEEGKIRKIEIPDGPDRFDHDCTNHYHVRCCKCGRAFDVDMETVSDLTQKVKNTHGFEFLDYDIIFKGICPDCRKNDAYTHGNGR